LCLHHLALGHIHQNGYILNHQDELVQDGFKICLEQLHLLLRFAAASAAPYPRLSCHSLLFQNGRKVTTNPPLKPQKQKKILMPSSTGLSRLEEAPVKTTEYKSIQIFLLLFSSQSLLCG